MIGRLSLLPLVALASVAGPARATDRVDRCDLIVMGRVDGSPRNEFTAAGDSDAAAWMPSVGVTFTVAADVAEVWLWDVGSGVPRTISGKTTPPDRALRVVPGQRVTLPGATTEQDRACEGRAMY